MQKRIMILGNGIVGNLCALYLHRKLGADADIVVVGPESRGGLPVVGESTIEITAALLEDDLGLGDYLRTTHYPKFGLTYYFQLDPSQPDERTYSVHCNEAAPTDLKPLPGWEGPWARPPSWQLNREVFDRDIRRLVDEAGIERIDGLATDVTLDGASGHQLTITETEGGGTREERADWLIDASGRKRFLARRLDLTVKSEEQRNAFWFRLDGFDRSHLEAIEALGPQPDPPGEPYHHDRYYTTHHFFGRGNWIWCIPLRTADGSERISIGHSSRPEYFQGDVRTIESFLDHVRTEHPAIADLVESGDVDDTNVLRKYHYTAKQVYSPDRWCLLGDAACTLDPLFSNGLAFASMAMRQIGSMISRDIEGRHDPEYIATLSDALLAPLDASQSAIGHWYPTMHDAYLANLRLYWIEISYFYLLLPSVHNRCYYEPEGLPLWRQVFGHRRDREDRFDLPRPLVESRKSFDIPRPEHFIYMGKEKVNPRALENVESLNGLREQYAAGSRLRTKLMTETLKRVKPGSG